METALPMLLFFGSLLGFGMLILICMQQSRDLEQADREAALKTERDLRATSLSPASFLSGRPVSPEDEDSIVSSIEQYLQEQQTFARHFIEEPSVESLYRRKEPEFARKAFERIEGFLKREQKIVKEFLSRPSVEMLFQSLTAPTAG